LSKAAHDWATRQAIADGAMKGVLLQLSYMHRDGKPLYPSQQTLAAKTGMSARTIWTAIRLLEHFGVISRQRRSLGWHGRGSDQFTLAIEHEFTLTRVAIAASRRSLSKSQNLQLANSASATRKGCERVEGEEVEPSQGRGPEETVIGNTREAIPTAGGLRVLAGGRS
jgi:biotin operon repressor